MYIDCSNVSKRYSERWILRKVDMHFAPDVSYGLRGANGSGKSTFLKILSGYLSPSKGQVTYTLDSKKVSRDDVYRYISMWGPHIGLSEQLTIAEMVDYVTRHRPLRVGMDTATFYRQLEWQVPVQSMIGTLSSGQRQRLGIALTILADTEVALLDEPGSFLDHRAQTWMKRLIADHSKDRLIIIASNDPNDLSDCSIQMQIDNQGRLSLS